MKERTVEQIAAPRTPHFVGDGFRVHNFIPSAAGMSMQRMDPFILLDYNSKYTFPPSNVPRGVGVHPHKGFETVTIAYKGKVAHHDSGGGGGVISEGDVQWMTAGNGVLHKEYHEEEWSKKGGEFHMVQLWVNLPKKHKSSNPSYQSIKRNEIQKHEIEEGKGIVEVIAGEYHGTHGPADTFTPIHVYNLRLSKTAKVTFDFPQNYNTALLILEGSILLNGKDQAPTDHFVVMANDGENFSVEATEDALVLLLSGEPINEPIAAQGPFVMNTHEELQQAYSDFRSGKFGHLED